MERWQGRVALVTGASAGIGKSIAMELARQGMVVVGLARRMDRLKAIEEELLAEGKSFKGRTCDITDEVAVLKEFAWIEQTFGKLDILVNNAGVGGAASLSDGKTELWQNIYDVNLISVAICTREAIKLMRKCGIDDGHLIFINSLVGHIITPLLGGGIYSASKHGVTVLANSARQELVAIGSKIRITSISPSFTKTEIFEVYGRKIDKNVQMLEPKDLADIVTWVVSAASNVHISEVIVRPTGTEH